MLMDEFLRPDSCPGGADECAALRARLVGVYIPGIAVLDPSAVAVPLCTGPAQVGTAAVWMTATADADATRDTLVGRKYAMADRRHAQPHNPV